MNNPWPLCLIAGSLLCSCAVKSSHIPDSDPAQQTIESPQKQALLEQAPITQLPFGPVTHPDSNICDVDTSFYYDLIGENVGRDTGFKPTNNFTLPPISTYLYTIVDASYGDNRCNRDIPVESLITLTHYKARLPDQHGFEIYYSSNEAKVSDEFSEAFRKTCGNFYFTYYGYLVVYDKKTRTARLLPLFHERYIDSLRVQQFHIDENYGISICNKMWAEGDEEWTVEEAYRIHLKEGGDFEIEKADLGG